MVAADTYGNDGFRSLYPFASRYTTIGEHRLHYIDEGDGEPMLMLHGNPTWSFYYRHLIKAFSPRFRTICPDHIGCGLSDKPPAHRYAYTLDQRIGDLEQLLSVLGVEKDITLVVHDWGGMMGLALAVRHPQRFKRIVVTNTAAFPPPNGKPLPWRLRLLRHLPVLSKPAVCGLNLFARSALVMAPKKALPKQVREGLIAPYDSWRNRIATYRFVRDIPLKPGDPSYQTVQRVAHALHRLSNVPMLICWGKHDFVFDGDYFDEWRRRFPAAHAHMFQEAGHYLLEDAPEEVTAAMAAFFAHHP